MANNQMVNATADEVIHLFEVIQKYGTTCGLEFSTEKTLDPLMGISSVLVKVDYFEGGEEGDSVVIELGETEFSFDLKNHGFSKDVSDCQIIILVTENEGAYAAWFNSGDIPPEGIAEANNYSKREPLELVIADGSTMDPEMVQAMIEHIADGMTFVKAEYVGCDLTVTLASEELRP